MKNILKGSGVLLVGIILYSLTSCYYDKRDLISPPSLSTTSCDTVNVTYTNQVKSVLSGACTGCHQGGGGSGGVVLDTYTGIQACGTARLLGSIKHQSPYSAMPQGGTKLPDCQIAVIEKWIQNGAPNN
jgi:mono/diheme cytochrome c family protein